MKEKPILLAASVFVATVIVMYLLLDSDFDDRTKIVSGTIILISGIIMLVVSIAKPNACNVLAVFFLVAIIVTFVIPERNFFGLECNFFTLFAPFLLSLYLAPKYIMETLPLLVRIMTWALLVGMLYFAARLLLAGIDVFRAETDILEATKALVLAATLFTIICTFGIYLLHESKDYCCKWKNLDTFPMPVTDDGMDLRKELPKIRPRNDSG